MGSVVFNQGEPTGGEMGFLGEFCAYYLVWLNPRLECVDVVLIQVVKT